MSDPVPRGPDQWPILAEGVGPRVGSDVGNRLDRRCNTGDNTFGPVADFDGDGRAEVLVTSPWGLGVLKLSESTLTAPMMARNGTRFGGWLLNTADNEF